MCVEVSQVEQRQVGCGWQVMIKNRRDKEEEDMLKKDEGQVGVDCLTKYWECGVSKVGAGGRLEEE